MFLEDCFGAGAKENTIIFHSRTYDEFVNEEDDGSVGHPPPTEKPIAMKFCTCAQNIFSSLCTLIWGHSVTTCRERLSNAKLLKYSLSFSEKLGLSQRIFGEAGTHYL